MMKTKILLQHDRLVMHTYIFIQNC